MRIEDYPPQEPMPEFAREYAKDVMRLGDGLLPTERAYGNDPYQSISLQVPEKPNGTMLAMVHGGGWTCGYKEHMNFIGPAITAGGTIYASIGYRLAPAQVFPTGTDDVADAITWLYQHAAEYGGDPNRIFVGGHSAGGHYSALLSVRRDWQGMRNLPADAIRGCLPVSGVYKFGDGSGLANRPRFLGDDLGTDRAASPIHNIDATPPFFITYGENDFPHLVKQASEMREALSDKGGEIAELMLPGCDHLTACLSLGKKNGLWAPAALAWMNAN